MSANHDVESRRGPASNVPNGRRQAYVVALRVRAIQPAAVDRDVEFARNVLEFRPQKRKSRCRRQLPGLKQFMTRQAGERTPGYIAKIVHTCLLGSESDRLQFLYDRGHAFNGYPAQLDILARREVAHAASEVA